MDFNDSDFDGFIANAIITQVDAVVKSGKEATVYRCSAHPLTGFETAAVKVYKEIEERSFRNMNQYLDGRIGRTIRKRRDILHMMSSPKSMQAYWVYAEYEALENLYSLGLSVPKPLACSEEGNAIAMEFVGDTIGSNESAPRLRDAKLTKDEYQNCFESILRAIEIMLRNDLIHGDLSPYNILIRDTLPVIIDFPQVIDARYHSQGAEMLERDITNICSFFEHKGLVLEKSASDLSHELWSLYYSNKL